MTVWVTQHDAFALFAARHAFDGRPFRSADAPEEAVPQEGGFFAVETPVYLLTISTAGALEKFLKQAAVDAVVTVAKPALLREVPPRAVYDEPQVKERLRALLPGAAFAPWAPLRREGLRAALAALPWVLDFIAAGAEVNAEVLRGLLSEEDAAIVYPTGAAGGRFELLPGDDYGLLCFETEKLYRAFLRDPELPGFARKAAALQAAKIRCKRGAGRAFIYG